MRTDLPLHPDKRDLYGASLRPPPGTVFDAGVATSFSLDFETALAIPVTLALFASESQDELLRSPLALLEGLERTADRLAIFCEAGRIKAQPGPQSRLCTLLEQMITEVVAPRGGAFHPKLWLLRYRPLDPGERTQLRLLVLSRNLTRDRSWDLSLCLDGEVGRGRRAGNRPLVEFMQRLPSLAVTTLPAHVGPLVTDLADDLRHTDWTLPAPFQSVSFAVNGMKRGGWKPKPCSRLGIVSPFCDADTLEMLAGLPDREPPRLVGRSEELIALPPGVLERFSEVSVMDEFAETEDGEGDDSDDEAARPLSGLHAKAFLQEIGWNTAITVGSGNATRPALLTGRNVEVFVTLTGRRAKVGSVADILGPGGFGRVLRPFRPAEVPEGDAERRTAEERVERARRELANAGLVLRCTAERSAEGAEPLWQVTLEADSALRLDGLAAATVWPITRGEAHARDVLASIHRGEPFEIATLPLVDVTRFLSFRLRDTTGKAEALFTLGLEIEGLPADRHRAVLRSVIDSREAFLRYLRLLLADLTDPLAAQLAAGSADRPTGWSAAADDEPILEDMVRALSHGRDRLIAVRRLMERLESAPAESETAVVPEDFVQLWNAFRTVLDERGAS